MLVTLLLNVSTEIADGLLQETVLAPYGEHPHTAGLQLVDAPAVERMLAAMSADGRDVCVDYLHNSIKSDDPQKAIAAGWVLWNTAKITPAGLTATIKWNDDAATLIRDKKYRFLSPVFMANGGVITKLVNLGLTNNPNIPAMPPLSNQTQFSTQQEKPKMKDLLKKLGLAETATEADAIAAVEKLQANSAGSAGLLARLQVNDFTAATARLTELLAPPAYNPADVSAMQARITAMESAEKQRGAELLVNDALAAGKLTPAQKAWALGYAAENPEGFRGYIANAQVIVPLAASGADGKKVAANAGVVTDEVKLIANQLGLKPEDLAKVS
ncbi:MAG: hypothetical protein HZB29_09830 [Nitrospinae bacterium]|nr:hypothetical protein [Nitrospinota bacterium]